MLYTVNPANAMDYEYVVRLCTPGSSKYTNELLVVSKKMIPEIIGLMAQP